MFIFSSDENVFKFLVQRGENILISSLLKSELELMLFFVFKLDLEILDFSKFKLAFSLIFIFSELILLLFFLTFLDKQFIRLLL